MQFLNLSRGSLFKSMLLEAVPWHIYQVFFCHIWAVWRHIRLERSDIITLQEYSALAKQLSSTSKLNSLPTVRSINNLHFWMPDGEGWMDSSPWTQSSLYSSFCYRWGQSSQYFQHDREMFLSLSNLQHQCHSWPSQQLNRILWSKMILNLSHHHWTWHYWTVGCCEVRRWRVPREGDLYRGSWCWGKHHA